METINEIEKEFFPEYFDNSKPSKTPEIYLIYRNFMIDLYREDPRNYISSIFFT